MWIRRTIPTRTWACRRGPSGILARLRCERRLHQHTRIISILWPTLREDIASPQRWKSTIGTCRGIVGLWPGCRRIRHRRPKTASVEAPIAELMEPSDRRGIKSEAREYERNQKA